METALHFSCTQLEAATAPAEEGWSTGASRAAAGDCIGGGGGGRKAAVGM